MLWAECLGALAAAVIGVGDRKSLGTTVGRGGGDVWATIDMGLDPAMIGRAATEG